VRDRIDALEEAIQIIRGLWSEPRYTFEGRSYHTRDAQLEPKPEHPIPIWLGTHGKRGLALAGGHADGWIPSLDLAPPEQVPAMAELIQRGARAANRDPRSIAWIYNVQVRIDGRADQVEGLVAGKPDEIADRLARFVKLGFSGFNLIPAGADADEQVALLGAEVIPSVRAMV
jgi:alkanesulfonate monooxygenase SsuD/methylene tetrahydromethanopterin reductase-like flavin-dependent oxidoreductase (luciferase family)